MSGLTLIQVFTNDDSDTWELACGNAVAAACRRRGFSQRRVCDILGWAPSRFSDLKSGSKSFRLRTLYLISDAIGVSPLDLLSEIKPNQVPDDAP